MFFLQERVGVFVVDVIEDGKNGYCSPSFDDEDFYQTIRRTLGERGKLS